MRRKGSVAYFGINGGQIGAGWKQSICSCVFIWCASLYNIDLWRENSSARRRESASIGSDSSDGRPRKSNHLPNLRLLNTRVLITPANGPNTELAKNLILAGVNVTIYDDAIVTEDDFESNFLIAEGDIGKKRSVVIF